jgi:hypothetical protein
MLAGISEAADEMELLMVAQVEWEELYALQNQLASHTLILPEEEFPRLQIAIDTN